MTTNKEQRREKMSYHLKYYKENRDKCIERAKTFREKYPWRSSFYGAKNRCIGKGKYVKFGIKFKMTMDDFKTLWIRDKAHLMESPSIDRIDNYGDYVLENCRFIERNENSQRAKRPRPQKVKKSISKWWHENGRTTPVLQLNDKFEVINKFPSIMEASRKTGARHGAINSCCNGKKVHCGKGYRWSYDK